MAQLSRDAGSSPEPRGGSKTEEQQRNAGNGGVTNYRMSVIVAVLAVAFGTRIWKLGVPDTPIFDEVHGGRFLNFYYSGKYFFDIHPPLIRILNLWSGVALGFRGEEHCTYGVDAVLAGKPFDLGENKNEKCEMWQLRVLPAALGASVLLLAYLTCRQMRMSTPSSLLGVLLLTCDNLELVMSRVHMVDIGFHFFLTLTVYLTLRYGSATLTNGTPWACLRALVLIGLSLGCALNSRYGMGLPAVAWVGAYTAGLLAYVTYTRGLLRALPDALLRATVLLGIPVLLYVGCFALHMRLLPHAGTGDGYMSPSFQSRLQGNHFQNILPERLRPSLWDCLVEFTRTAYRYNQDMAVFFPPGSMTHDSMPASWVYQGRGTLFVVGNDADIGSVNAGRVLPGHSSEQEVTVYYFNGNPVLLFLYQASLLTEVAMWVLAAPTATGRAWLRRVHGLWFGLLLLLGWMLHYLPFFLLRRQMFVHYILPASHFGVLHLALSLHRLTGSNLVRSKPRALRWALRGLVLAPCAAMFLYLMPLAGLTPLSMKGAISRLWWATGDCWVPGGSCQYSPSWGGRMAGQKRCRGLEGS
eukprot:jgi/Mesvir1/16681/Mv15080-RA.1